MVPYVVEEFRYGNAQFFVLALTVGGLLFLRERPAAAAASLGLAISLKVWPVFFIPYLAVRREWKTVALTLAFAAFLSLLPSLYFGLSGNFDLLQQWYAQESQTQLGKSEIWFPNQSLRGVLMRYLTVIDYSHVPDSNYAAVNIAAMDPARVRLLWVIVAAAIYAGFLLLAYRRRKTNGWLDHGLAFCLLALLEPFTQKYALVILLWPAIAVTGSMNNRPVRILMFCATVLVLIQSLVPGATAQRLLQVLGLDFGAALLLTVAIGAATVGRVGLASGPEGV
jgi:Glycosyltransferase family 87